MNKSEVEVGQYWCSHYSFPKIGYYTVEILEVLEDGVMTRFTASEWKDGHWVENSFMKFDALLGGYFRL